MKAHALDLLANVGPRFPGLVQNLIFALEEYDRRLEEFDLPPTPELAEHRARVRKLVEELKDWEFGE